MPVGPSIGISTEHAELGTSLRAWAAGLDAMADVRKAETEADASFDRVWAAVSGMGLATITLPEAAGGGGGTLLDAAVALEACADALLPGHLWSTAIAAALLADVPAAAEVLASGGRFAVAPTPSLVETDGALSGSVDVVWDLPGADRVLVGTVDDGWFVLPADRVSGTPRVALDLTRRVGGLVVDRLPVSEAVRVADLDAARVRRTAVVLAAAEASGIARWCLGTAVEHAKVREQFGRPIGSFQAVKQLCATMLETAESVTACAWDAAAAGDDREQAAFAADVAGTVALDGAVRVAQDCIQVLGGIGFTFEHEAHFRLRRAVALRTMLGGSQRWAASLADRARAGGRRLLSVDLDGRDREVRPEVRRRIEQVTAAADRRVALVETGLMAPHWPAPYGLDADPVTQLVVDEELAAAGITRPDLKIGGWAVPTILAHGTDAQRERFVRPTLLGEVVWCQLFSEPGAGSDLASLRTRAERVGGGWRLTGQKVWTSLAREAGWGICLARTDPEAPQHRGITYFLVDMASEGIDIRPLREMTGDELFNEVFLDGVVVPDEMVVGEVGGGWRLARTTLANERVAMAGHRLGVSTEGAVAALGETPGEADRVRVGRAVALATVCALLGARATLRSLAGHGPGAESSVAKLLGVRNRQDASELLVDLLGDEVLLDTERSREAVHEMLLTRCLSIAGGTTQVLRNVAAERVLGLPR